jgi:hypothetical protein
MKEKQIKRRKKVKKYWDFRVLKFNLGMKVKNGRRKIPDFRTY